MIINAHATVTTKPLGDRIIHLLFCEMLSQSENEDVNLICGHFKDFDQLKNLLGSDRVFLNKKNVIPKKTVNIKYPRSPTGSCSDNYDLSIHDVWGSVKELPKCKNIKNFNQELPKKYITVQWDARQKYRFILPEKIKKIENYYLQSGFEIIQIGANGSGRASTDLDYIAYLISNADLHVGASSGMAYFSQMILPCEKIHIYSGEKTAQEKYPRGIFGSKKWKLGDVDEMAQLIIDKGAKLNYYKVN